MEKYLNGCFFNGRSCHNFAALEELISYILSYFLGYEIVVSKYIFFHALEGPEKSESALEFPSSNATELWWELPHEVQVFCLKASAFGNAIAN